HLAQATGSFNQVASFGIAHQGLLQPAEGVVIEIVVAMPLEGRQLDEDRFHRDIIRRLRIGAKAVRFRVNNGGQGRTRTTDTRIFSPFSVVLARGLKLNHLRCLPALTPASPMVESTSGAVVVEASELLPLL